MEFKRCSGILMPISSLPGGYGIGSMGKPAHEFVDFLAKAGQTIWQILPVGPTGYADSPYQSCSAFAGNPYFIDLDLLAADGLLTKKDYAAINWGGDAAHVDYGTLYEKRFAVLRKAYANFLKKRPVPGYETPYPDDWYRFRFLSSDWLPDYCLYMAIKEANGMVDWQKWPRALRVREPEALAEFKAEHAGEIEFWAFLQYEFDRQWRALHAYAKEKGVAIMGDIPIYVAADSADAWAGRELFETDAEGKPRRVAGCPPDYFAADGQLWGNPLYDWDYHRRTGYAWWILRIRHALSIYDILRIDHFRGFDTYWAIPAGETTARNGRWEQGPRMELFRALHNALGMLLLRNDHPVRPQLLQHPAVGFVVGLADDLRHAKLLQIHGRQHRRAQITADGHNGAVEIRHTQRLEHILVLGVAHHSPGHIPSDLLDFFTALVNHHHLAPQRAEVFGHVDAEAAKADNHIRFHPFFSPIRS